MKLSLQAAALLSRKTLNDDHSTTHPITGPNTIGAFAPAIAGLAVSTYATARYSLKNVTQILNLQVSGPARATAPLTTMAAQIRT